MELVSLNLYFETRKLFPTVLFEIFGIKNSSFAGQLMEEEQDEEGGKRKENRDAEDKVGD